MRFGAAQLLQHRRVFASRDPDEARVFMREKEFELELAPREARAFDLRANAAYLPNSYIGYVRYGAAVQVRVPPDRKRDDYWLHFSLRGSSEVINHVGAVECTAGQAVVSSPAGHVMRSARGSARITVSLTKAAIVDQLAALLADAPARPPEFSPIVNLASADAQRLTRHVGLAAAELDDPASARNPILLGMYEQLIMTGLLLCQVNNYTDALCRLETHMAPRDVKRALDYMQGHLDAAVTLADIVAAAGVPGRTLLQHFKDHRGTSPMRYLREARLARVRDALLRTDADESVTQIAMSFGFAHLGRFALEYRRHFGESPSETRARKRSAPVRLS